MKKADTIISSLGIPKIESPIKGRRSKFISDDEDRVFLDIWEKHISENLKNNIEIPTLELAGAREKIYFEPKKVKCAIVTCGGLCPGLNDIIRAIVLELYYAYGAKNIVGIQYGLQGLVPKYNHDFVDLNPKTVESIHGMGGTILGSSRERQDVDTIVDSLNRYNIGVLFMVGGDGTLTAANAIADEIESQALKIGVVGIPKTIDNDIFMISRSFGFDTAVEQAAIAIKGAHAEAAGYPNGVGLLKLMGRYSGFIAATATLAQQDVNFVLVPEVDFDLNVFLKSLENRLKERKHAVIVVAEGAGRKFFKDDPDNIKTNDIGLFLKKEITDYFSANKISINLKFIDPSYIIRSLPANANDHAFCSFLGRDAVHAAMAGKTKMLIGYRHDKFVHIPLSLCEGKRKTMLPDGKLWASVLEATGQGSLKA